MLAGGAFRGAIAPSWVLGDFKSENVPAIERRGRKGAGRGAPRVEYGLGQGLVRELAKPGSAPLGAPARQKSPRPSSASFSQNSS